MTMTPPESIGLNPPSPPKLNPPPYPCAPPAITLPLLGLNPPLRLALIFIVPLPYPPVRNADPKPIPMGAESDRAREILRCVPPGVETDVGVVLALPPTTLPPGVVGTVLPKVVTLDTDAADENGELEGVNPNTLPFVTELAALEVDAAAAPGSAILISIASDNPRFDILLSIARAMFIFSGLCSVRWRLFDGRPSVPLVPGRPSLLDEESWSRLGEEDKGGTGAAPDEDESNRACELS